jgi:hypothetical protein
LLNEVEFDFLHHLEYFDFGPLMGSGERGYVGYVPLGGGAGRASGNSEILRRLLLLIARRGCVRIMIFEPALWAVLLF